LSKPHERQQTTMRRYRTQEVALAGSSRGRLAEWDGQSLDPLERAVLTQTKRVWYTRARDKQSCVSAGGEKERLVITGRSATDQNRGSSA
jgi:hypothetical protein